MVFVLPLSACGDVAHSSSAASSTVTDDAVSEASSAVNTNTSLEVNSTVSKNNLPPPTGGNSSVTSSKNNLPAPGTQGGSSEENKIKLGDTGWRSHPWDYKLIALTFDDAPFFAEAQGNITTKMINTVVKYEGHSTVFVVGNTTDNGKNYGAAVLGTDLLKYALDKGFELGNHSFGHTNMKGKDVSTIVSGIESLNDLLKDKLGVTPKFFRPPYLGVDSNVYAACAQLNMGCVNMNINTYDYDSATTVQDILNKCSAPADGSIVLLHSKYQVTADAIEPLCKQLYDKGYRFVTLSELFKAKGRQVPMNETFSPTEYDINEATPATTTTRNGASVNIVDNIADMEFAAGYSFNGGDVNHVSSVGRAASLYYVLKVNGGETISLTQAVSGTTVSYSFTEFSDIPLTKSNFTAGGLAFTSWLSGGYTLKADTRYIIIGFKNGDGSADFTEEQCRQLKNCLTFS